MWERDLTALLYSLRLQKIVSYFSKVVLTTNLPHLPVPASPPTSVTAVADSSTSISVSWDMIPPIDQNGIIVLYEVLYQPLETFNGTIGPMTETVTMLNMTVTPKVTLTGLQEFVEYNISIRAFTVVGPSPYSEVVLQRTFEDGKNLAIYREYRY